MAPTFSGGKLNLKGSTKAKKKSKKSKHKVDVDNQRDKHETEQIINDDVNKGDDSDEDDLTAAEKMSLKRKKQREKEELEKIGKKSHRERVEEFNEKLGKLTEHNDIPRVRLLKLFWSKFFVLV